MSAKICGVAYARGRVSRERPHWLLYHRRPQDRCHRKSGPSIQVKDPPTVKMGFRLKTELSVVGVKEAEHVAIASSKHKYLYLIPNTPNKCLLCEWKILTPPPSKVQCLQGAAHGSLRASSHPTAV